ncbi:MAG: 4-alpha-glucanotransferase [Thermoanaerobaculia bacterium]|nr:4-alpha-glucanotransferase [Thermoanaerobaculia bacterium]
MAHTSDTLDRNTKRVAGVLLHPTSLPGRFGTGDLGDEAIAFLDWAASAGMKLWQVLPLNPPGFGYSPYGCTSSVAGNPLLISPQRLLQENLLTADDLAHPPDFPADEASFDRSETWKGRLLRIAWDRFQRKATAEQKSKLEAFENAPEQKDWLHDFALYMALKERAAGVPWWEWPAGFAARDKQAITRAERELDGEIRFQKFIQHHFFAQWKLVHEAAKARGISIMGDVPIYVASDSADVWSHKDLFQLDEKGAPLVVAGVPPDYFSATGQRWGNPLYRWDVMQKTGFAWWIARVRANLRLADTIRLDHFRGFAAYWEIPAHEPTAVNGRWMPGPGMALFDALRAALGDLPLVAEDLGFITPEVNELRRGSGFAGMKILQFGFSQPDSIHLPHRFESHTAVYTGTHDNDTARGWFDTAPANDQALARTYLGDDCSDFAWSLIRAAYTSVADIAIVPAQDILGLGSEARMNRPGDTLHNWRWRVRDGALTPDHAQRLKRLAELTGRV